MNSQDRLRIWIERGNVHISQLFFHSYKKLGIRDMDALLVLQLMSFAEDGNGLPGPSDIAIRMSLPEEEIGSGLQRLMQSGFLAIERTMDDDGRLSESYSLHPLWNRLVDEEIHLCDGQAQADRQAEEGEIFAIFEQEFGRLLSPMECETISMWFDEDGHSPELIKAALREAVIARKVSLRYIDRILFEWKKKNVRSVSDAEEEARQFREGGAPARQSQHHAEEPAPKVQFYNWLEDRN
ncbi:DnaD domain-containing protein [Bhargavaea ullalensis]|uniref:DNA replication protein n=1 Tax=Bhargavaea ullalensis TaxID=1265685 RepID=A0ABV2GAI5_9BACL